MKCLSVSNCSCIQCPFTHLFEKAACGRVRIRASMHAALHFPSVPSSLSFLSALGCGGGGGGGLESCSLSRSARPSFFWRRRALKSPHPIGLFGEKKSPTTPSRLTAKMQWSREPHFFKNKKLHRSDTGIIHCFFFQCVYFFKASCLSAARP